MVGIWQSVLSFTTVTEIGLSCDNSQSSRPYIKQALRGLWQEGVFCWPIIFAISLVRCLTDLLLHPPLAFQRLKNLSKSQRIKERNEEEKLLSRLELSTFITTQLPAMPFTNQQSSDGTYVVTIYEFSIKVF